MRIQIPHNWLPRPYQKPAWDYLERGGRHAELIWHRRSGKDDVALHRTVVAAFERVATYWHMLPLATQARKAIWDAINPHSGLRRIDEAFPPALRANTRDQEMLIKFVNGSTFQVVGSDNFNAMVGSPPAGIVYSEWALANPAARAYLRPIIAENNGWQIFITTPRGKNHAYQTYNAALKDPKCFAQKLPATETGAFSDEQLEEERNAYIADFGQDMGNALFEQEYLVSFDAAILGAYYGAELRAAREEGRICALPYDPCLPVHLALDIGFTDDTAAWFFQVAHDEVRFIDYFATHGQPVAFYDQVFRARGYDYAQDGKRPVIWLPHDARAKSLQTGRSTEQQFGALGWTVRITPMLSLQDGIQAGRQTFARAWFDEDKCAEGLDALASYQREWLDEAKCFADRPLHNWASHAADSYRYASLVWRNTMAPKEPEPPKFPLDRTISELIEAARRKRLGGE